MAKKTWAEKFNDGKPHQIKPVPMNIAGMKKGEIMLIPTPKIVDAFIRKIPKGKSMDVKTLRQKLARKHKAEVTCPITTGFHLRTVAEVAFEQFDQGKSLAKITPVWRVIDEKSTTLKKLSFDTKFIFQQREAEGL